ARDRSFLGQADEDGAIGKVARDARKAVHELTGHAVSSIGSKAASGYQDRRTGDGAPRDVPIAARTAARSSRCASIGLLALPPGAQNLRDILADGAAILRHLLDRAAATPPARGNPPLLEAREHRPRAIFDGPRNADRSLARTEAHEVPLRAAAWI